MKEATDTKGMTTTRDEEGTECIGCSNFVYDDYELCNECRGISKETLEEWFDDMLDQSNGSVKILGMHFNPSFVLKQCDPIAYRISLADYAGNVERDGFLIKGYSSDI